MNMPIGGFFELELPEKEEYHICKIKLNFARHAISLFFKSIGVKRVHVPTFICSSVPDTLIANALDVVYYNVKDIINPTIPKIEEDEGLIIVNYFGVTNIDGVFTHIKQSKNVILDNSHGFFSVPKNFENVVYSARKFFGVPDGAYLKTNELIDIYDTLTKFKSIDYSRHLIQRIEEGPENAYEDYKRTKELIKQTIPQKISKFSLRILRSIDYNNVIKIRNNNFSFYHSHLKHENLLSLSKYNSSLCYPLLLDNGEEIRRELINNKIFIPKYWPNVITNKYSDQYDRYISNKIVCLPIDQRYDIKELSHVIKELEKI